MNPTAKNWAPALLFLALALPLASARPLWLDEILQLMDTRQPSTSALLARLSRSDPGNAPLGYLVQHEALLITGYSPWRARLPAVLFGAGAIFLAALLGTRFGLSAGWRSAALLALFPLMLRYGTEGRVYSQALFFSILATWIYLRLARSPGWMLAGAYCLALVACAYTLPYAGSVGMAHVLWTVSEGRWKPAVPGAVALALAAAAFLPWYLHAKALWTADLAGTYQFSASPKTPLMILREFTGAGYWGSSLLAILCALTIARRYLPTNTLKLLVLLTVAPIASALASDAYFGYFLAVRQFLWALPAASILAAAAIERGSRTARVAAGLFAVAAIWSSVRFYSGPHENWQAAADALADRVQHGDCLTVAPPEHRFIYEFLRPDLERAGCRGNRTVLAVTPYATAQQRQAAIAELLSAGWRQERTNSVGASSIIQFLCR